MTRFNLTKDHLLKILEFIEAINPRDPQVILSVDQSSGIGNIIKATIPNNLIHGVVVDLVLEVCGEECW